MKKIEEKTHVKANLLILIKYFIQRSMTSVQFSIEISELVLAVGVPLFF